MQPMETDVAIAGAGPAGALLACLLGRQGIAVTLIEKHSDLGREFRGEHLHDDSVALLKRHGLWDAVAAAGLLPMEAVEIMQGTRTVLSITPELFDISHVGIHIPQEHLLRPMVTAAACHPGFRLLLGATVTGLQRDEHNRVVGLLLSTPDGPQAIRAKLVVGADGRYSAVRKHSGIPTRHWKHGYDVLWAKVPAPANWPPRIRFGWVGDHGFTLFSAYPQHVQVGWRLPEGGFKALREQPFSVFIRVYSQAAPELTPAICEHLRDWSDLTLLSVQSCMVERWADDGLLLIGDAAHTMSPSGGIGVNTAMADSEVAAEVITTALAQDDVSRLALQAVEQRRRPAVERQQATQLKQEAQNLTMTRSRVARWFFFQSLKVLNRSPWKRQFMARQFVVK